MTASPVRWQTRSVGALSGALVCAAIAIVTRESDTSLIPAAAATGAPIALVLGFWKAPAIRDAADDGAVFDNVLRTSAIAVPIGSVIVAAVVLAVPALAKDPIDLPALAAILPLAIMGIVILGLPAWAFGIVVVGGWAILLRLLPDRLIGRSVAP